MPSETEGLAIALSLARVGEMFTSAEWVSRRETDSCEDEDDIAVRELLLLLKSCPAELGASVGPPEAGLCGRVGCPFN